MSSQTNQTQITSFLTRAKRLATAGQYDFVPRRKNMQDLAAHNLTIRDAIDEIVNLTTADYYKGAETGF